MKCEKKIPNGVNIDANGKVEFRIINISEMENHLIGEIELINDLELTLENKLKK